MEALKFSSVEELYNRLIPALNCKENELKKMGYKYIKAVDIWNALKTHKWRNSTDLSLCEMVDDILNTENSFFDNYVKSLFSKIKREAYLDKDDIL